MVSDLNKKIEKLKEMAIGRCRERIEQVACKAKGLIKGQKPEEHEEGNTNHTQPYGVTSFLKKRHGL